MSDEASLKRQNSFFEIYSNSMWGTRSKSGPGSEIGNAVEYVNFIRQLFEDFSDINCILDVGHGDWQMWPKDFFKDKQYVGIDIVPDLSKKLQELNKAENIQFLHADFFNHPVEGYDLCLVKDVAIHMTHSEINSMLGMLNKVRYVVICVDIQISGPRAIARKVLEFFGKNKFDEWGDIASGGYHLVNLSNETLYPNVRLFRKDRFRDYQVKEGIFGRDIKKRVWLLIKNE